MSHARLDAWPSSRYETATRSPRSAGGDPAVHAYALGDLDDFFWPHTRWFAWAPDGVIEQLVLLYDEPDPLVVHALAEPPARP